MTAKIIAQTHEGTAGLDERLSAAAVELSALGIELDAEGRWLFENASTRELKKTDVAQRLAQQQNYWSEQASLVEEGSFGIEGELPATATARQALSEAMRSYAVELGEEMRSRGIA